MKNILKRNLLVIFGIWLFLLAIPMFCGDALAIDDTHVTDQEVSAAVAGGQRYLVAQQEAPVFGTGAAVFTVVTSDFPEGTGPQEGEVYSPFVDLSGENTMVLFGPTVYDSEDTYTLEGVADGIVGTWQMSNDGTETFTINANDTFTYTETNGTTYTATGTYTYNPDTQWLKSGGYWNDNRQGQKVASTGTAVAALLETGYDRNSEVIEAGIMYLKQFVHNDPEDNYFGAIFDEYGGDGNYNNAIALVALSLYNDPSPAYQAIIQNSVNFIKSYQNLSPAPETNSYYGAWSYNWDPSPSGGDLSNTQFATMGLWYGYQYLGKAVPSEAWASALLQYLKRCQLWDNPDMLILNFANSDFPVESGLTAGTYHMTLVSVGAEEMVIKEQNTGDETSLDREGAGTTIVGTWHLYSEDGDATFTLNNNGTFTVAGKNASETENYSASGTYEHKTIGGWNDQAWVANYDVWGQYGNFSYSSTGSSFTTGTMLGAGLWCLGMIGQDTSDMANVAVGYFANDDNYTWDTGLSSNYYYAVYAMAKGLTATVGTSQKVGKYEWVQDLKDMLVDPDNEKILTVAESDPVQNYWQGAGGLDGGNILCTSWVLMSLAFSDINTESPQKILADDPVMDYPNRGRITLTVKNGVTISGAVRTAVEDAEKGTTVTMPIGAMKFTLNHVPVGGTAVLEIQVPENALDPTDKHSFINADGSIKDGLNWFKIKQGAWKKVDSVPIEIDKEANVIRVTLKDGGPEDDDGQADGKIVDPAAPGYGTEAPATGLDSGSDFCFIRTVLGR